MKKIILLNGQSGAGKTTVSLALFNKLNNSFLIEADNLVRVLPWRFNDELQKLAVINAASLINNFFNYKYTQGILSSGILNQALLDLLQSKLDQNTKLMYIWLFADKETRMKRKTARQRDESDDPKNFHFIDALIPDPGNLIIKNGVYLKMNSTDKTSKETAEEIYSQIAIILNNNNLTL